MLETLTRRPPATRRPLPPSRVIDSLSQSHAPLAASNQSHPRSVQLFLRRRHRFFNFTLDRTSRPARIIPGATHDLHCGREAGLKRTIENSILKDTVTFVRTAAETGGKLAELHVKLMPGGSNPLHHHTSYTETFTAIEGELGLELASGEKVFLKPGEAHFVNIGEVHRFFNATARPIEFVTLVKPGHQGFEDALRIVYGLAEDGLCNRKGIPKDIRHLALFAQMSDTRLSGWMSLATPVLRWIAAHAKRKGVELELIRRYCT